MTSKLFKNVSLRSSYISKICFSTELNNAVSSTTPQASFRCFENSPGNHRLEHVGLFYTIPEEIKIQLFKHGGLPKPFYEQLKTFRESSFMIRKPAVEILHYLNNTNYDRPLQKYVLYGKPGVGKSVTLAHIIHYAHSSDWIILHVPWVGNWLRSPREVTNSATREGCVDLPLNAVSWLLHFKSQNSGLLNKLNVTVQNEYTWSKREVTKVGDSLLSIVDLGINRVKYSSECILAIISELKIHSKQGKFKTLVAVDGFNAFFHPNTRVKTEEKVMVPPNKVTFIQGFLDASKADWHNAAAVLICDELTVPGHNASPMPLYQLTKEGFEFLDPFIPVEVPNFTEKETLSLLSYYKERKWLQNTQADEELVFISGGNGYRLMNLCASL